jgi:hypothetical protein
MVARQGVLCEQESRTSLKRSIPKTDEAMCLLRRRMIEDMTIREIAAIRRIAAKSHEGYIHTLKKFE